MSLIYSYQDSSMHSQCSRCAILFIYLYLVLYFLFQNFALTGIVRRKQQDLEPRPHYLSTYAFILPIFLEMESKHHSLPSRNVNTKTMYFSSTIFSTLIPPPIIISYILKSEKCERADFCRSKIIGTKNGRIHTKIHSTMQNHHFGHVSTFSLIAPVVREKIDFNH